LKRREKKGGPLMFLDPSTRQKIVDVKWYKAHLVPQVLGGRKTRKVKKSKKRTTYRVNRKSKKSRTTRKSKLTRSR